MSTVRTSAAIAGSPARKRNSHIWAHEPHDFYIEPQWRSQRLFVAEKFEGTIWDPACGIGRIVDAARSAGHTADESDLIDRGRGYRLDFLTSGATAPNIVSNPPFRIAEAFVKQALKLAERNVAMLLPAKWLQGDKRAKWLEGTPLRRVWFLCPRPSMPPGQVILAGEKPGGGREDFVWLVWLHGFDGHPEMRWLHRETAMSARPLRLILRHDTQAYELVAVEPHITRTGASSHYLVWQIPCRTCGEKFYGTSPATLRGIAKLHWQANCPAHRKQSTSSAAARNSELARRYEATAS